jgi:hypothetical protein
LSLYHGAEKKLPSPLKILRLYNPQQTEKYHEEHAELLLNSFVFSQIKNNMSANNCAQQQKEKIRFLDGYLTLWIFLAWVRLPWKLYPVQWKFHQLFSSGTTNIAIGLILMISSTCQSKIRANGRSL